MSISFNSNSIKSLFIGILLLPIIGWSDEGFYSPVALGVPKAIADSIVNIQIKLKVKFNVASPGPARVTDQDYLVWDLPDIKMWRLNTDNCSSVYFNSFPYFKEGCLALKKNTNTDQPIPVNYSASGVLISENGFILTAAHLVHSCMLYFKGNYPFSCPLVKIKETDFDQDASIKVHYIGDYEHPFDMEDFAILEIKGIRNAHHIKLRLAPQASSLNERVITIGYSVPSNRINKPIEYLDSDGSLKGSTGSLFKAELLPTETLLQLKEMGIPLEKYLYTDSDVIPGNSGGGAFSRGTNTFLGITVRGMAFGSQNENNIMTQYMADERKPNLILSVNTICESILKIKRLAWLCLTN